MLDSLRARWLDFWWRCAIFDRKRTLDVALAVLAFFIVSPLLLTLAASIYLCMGRPVFFLQQRTGLNGNLFEMVKFRTMRDEVDEKGFPLPDEQRSTRLGRFLRSTSLDELPELWNIMRGDMSFVGPRPLLPDYLPYYTNDQARRHNVRPGLTGWAQVNGRNAQSWDDRFAFDVEYVDTMSFLGDIRILALTVLRVFSRSGVSAAGHETMPRFDDQIRAGKAKGRLSGDQER